MGETGFRHNHGESAKPEITSLEKGKTFYTSNAGLKELRYEISQYLERKYQLVYHPDHEILVTVGGSEWN